MANSKVHFDASVDGSLHAWGHEGDKVNRVWCDEDSYDGVEGDVEDFLLSLPLGTGKHAASLEDAIGTRLRRSEHEKKECRLKFRQWCVCWDISDHDGCPLLIHHLSVDATASALCNLWQRTEWM